MSTENINIKVNVDSSNGVKSVDSLRSKMRELREAGAQLQTQNEGTSASALEQARTLGELQDAMGDAQAMARYFADDFRNVNTALQGLQGGIGIMTTLSAGVELFGGSSEAATEVIKKMQVAQAALNGVQAIQKVLNKDSYVMIAARVLQEKLLQKEIQKTAVSEGAATVATSALTAGEGAATAGAGALTTGLKAVGAAIKSIPVIGWILAAVAALGTLIGLIAKANEQESEGERIQREKFETQQKINEAYIEGEESIAKERRELEFALTDLNNCKEGTKKWNDSAAKVAETLGVSVDWIKENKDKVNELALAWLNVKKVQATQDVLLKNMAENDVKLEQLELAKAQLLAANVNQRRGVAEQWAEIFGWTEDQVDEIVDYVNKTKTKNEAQYRFEINNINAFFDVSKKQLESANAAYENSYNNLANSISSDTDKINESQKSVVKTAKEVANTVKDAAVDNTVVFKESKAAYVDLNAETEKLLGNLGKIATAGDAIEVSQWEDEDAKDIAKGEIYLWDQRMLVMDEHSDEYYNAMEEKLKLSLESGLITQYEYDAAIRDLEKNRTEYIQSEEERRKSIRESAAQEAFSGIHSIMDSAMSAELDMAEGNEKKQKQIRQKYAIANLVVNAAESAAALAVSIPKTLAAYSEIPFVGPALAAIQIAATTASIVAQIENIKKQKAEIMKAARGAFIVGPSHSQGGVTMEVEGGEAVLNKRAMAIPEYRALASYMNESTGGVAFPGGGSGSGAPIAATIDERTLDRIVSRVAAIPVVVSESSITSTQRRVSSIEGRSKL